MVHHVVSEKDPATFTFTCFLQEARVRGHTLPFLKELIGCL